MATSILRRAVFQKICRQKLSLCTVKPCRMTVRLLRTTPRIFSSKYFSEKHEWVEVENQTGTVGISDYAQDKLGDVVYVQLPEVGAELEMDAEAGVLESVKAASEIYTPVSGEVIETNSKVEETPGLINESPDDQGWLFKIKLSNPKELEELMNEDSYKTFLETLE